MIWDELKKPFLILAPMEGVTDVIFRQVVAHAGRPDLFFTEFTNVSSYASEKGRWNALERLTVAPTDPPIIAQIWGKNPDHFAACASALESLGFAGVDLNFGCPDKNVNRAGGGAAMIKTPDLALECFENARQNTNLPVSVKTRLGWAEVNEYREWLSTLLSAHPAALTVHLRTKKEMSKVPAHYELIPEIVALRDSISPTTKLIINGDIKDRAHALELHQKYPGVDGFMIGRGVFSNPYCFTDHQPTQEELMELLKLHLKLYEEYQNRALENFSEEHKNSSSRSIREECEDRVLRSIPIKHENSSSRSICEECEDRVLRSIFGDGPNTERPSPVTTGARERSEKPYPRALSHTLPYEPLKHFFKIYINNFPGASDLRAKLMETHSVKEAKAILYPDR